MSRSRAPSTDQQAVIDAILRTDFYAFVQAIFPIVSGGAQRLQRSSGVKPGAAFPRRLDADVADFDAGQ